MLHDWPAADIGAFIALLLLLLLLLSLLLLLLETAP
jgi:hypothetical protein